MAVCVQGFIAMYISMPYLVCSEAFMCIYIHINFSEVECMDGNHFNSFTSSIMN